MTTWKKRWNLIFVSVGNRDHGDDRLASLSGLRQADLVGDASRRLLPRAVSSRRVSSVGCEA